MKKILILLIGLTSFHLSICQNSKIDSLLGVLKIAKNDMYRLDLLSELAWEYRFQNPDTSILITKQIFNKFNIYDVSILFKSKTYSNFAVYQ